MLGIEISRPWTFPSGRSCSPKPATQSLERVGQRLWQNAGIGKRWTPQDV